MDKLKAMRYFCTIEQTGSFTAAAQQAKVPVSTLSRSIQALEAELGAELLKRSTRHVTMTEIGKIYLAQCQDILSAIERADGQVGSYQSSPSGVLRISALPYYGECQLMPVLELFQQQYPHIVIDLDLSSQVADLNRDGVDIAIRGGSAPEGRVIAQRLADNTHRLYATPEYLAEHGTPRCGEDLKQHHALLYRAPAKVLDWHVQTQGEWQPVVINTALISNSVRVIQQSLLAHKGLAMLPSWSVQRELAAERLVVLEMHDVLSVIAASPEASLYLLYQQPQYVIPKIKVAVDFLREHLSVDVSGAGYV